MRREVLRIVVVAGLCGAAVAAAFNGGRGGELLGLALAALAALEVRKGGG